MLKELPITLDMALEALSYDTAILVTEDSDYVGTVERLIGLGKKEELAISNLVKGIIFVNVVRVLDC